MGIQHDPASGLRGIHTAAPPAAGRSPRVLIVGAGMSGLLMGIRLKQAGIDSFTICEKGPSVGGTWRDNSYPGLACDVPARLYTYSFESNPLWDYRYARGYEIRRYFEAIPRKYALERHIRCNTEVVSASYQHGVWTAHTRDGQVLVADFLVTATGILHHPHTPELPGLERFAGACFHSARWDHSVSLAGKRVGVIGTGSTAVQITCALSGKVGAYKLFQRTAQWVCPQFDGPYSAANKRIVGGLPALLRAIHKLYGKFFEHTFARAVVGDKTMIGIISWLCRRHLAAVRDPELRRRLTPDYSPACKRLIFSDDFYQAMQQPGTELVTAGIERIVPEGIVDADGKLHELDVLVLATGFRAHQYMRPMRISGEHGLSLAQVWAGGASAHRTVALPGFPNCFVLMGPHSPIGNFSLIAIAELQAGYIMQLIELFRQGRCVSVQPRAEATRRYNAQLREALKGTVWVSGCNSWYLDQNGLPALWPWSYGRYRQEMRKPALEEFVLA